MFDHVGPLARSVADCALVMNALAGFDPLDPVSIDVPREDFHAAIGRDVSALRIGIPRTPFFDDLDPEIAAATDEAVRVIRGLTRSLTDFELPDVDAFAVLNAEIYEYHAPLVADPARRELYDPQTLGRIMGGANVSPNDYIQARRRMIIARNTINDLFADVDVLVLPTAMRRPVTVESALARTAVATDANLIRNTLSFDVYGIPTISVPCGFTRAGLPIGLQIAGPRLGEASVLALAHAYEQASGWDQSAPDPD
jgi:aspartyl-tRNA(Asn)/glutamyl-tRNA(Gln) amidotransferase subunit A